jgi:CHAT domain-containing protein
VFVASRTSIKAYELPARSEIERTAQRLYRLLRTPGSDSQVATGLAALKRDTSLQRAALDLSKMILTPVAGDIEGKRLLIVSEGALQYIPFAVLPEPNPTPTKGASQGPLLAEHEIVSLPSASVLAVVRQTEQGRQEPPKTVAVLADPVFEVSDERVKKGGAEITQASGILREGEAVSAPLMRSVADVRGSARTGIYLPRLVFTRREAEAIMAVTPPGQGLRVLDFEASRVRATSPELSQYRFIHIATHGLLDSEHPELSGLVLSLVDRQGKRQDGFLSLGDIYNLNLPVDLVVLSACETGLGKDIKGEGLIGLTRGFMYAGASRVIATTWTADDAATADLMASFYKMMEQDKLTPAAALRQTQLQMWKKRRWHDPYFWAGFQIQGEWR